jgi:hypothetical protein
MELDLNAVDNDWYAHVQVACFAGDSPDGGWDSVWQAIVGTSYGPENNWTISAQLAHELSTTASSEAPSTSVPSVQARYRC